MNKRAIMMHKKDNVATTLTDLKLGDRVVIEMDDQIISEVKVEEPVPFGHKLSLADIKRGDFIFKYGEVISRANKDISKGKHVHVHNTVTTRGK